MFWFLRKGDPWEPTFLSSSEPPVAAYCRWRFSSPEATSEPVTFVTQVDPEELATLQLIIVSDPAEVVRRVKHTTFGKDA